MHMKNKLPLPSVKKPSAHVKQRTPSWSKNSPGWQPGQVVPEKPIKSKKTLVLIILVLVFPHQIKVQKYVFVYVHSTVNVIRACIFIMLAVLKVTQRVPPTCIIKISRTAFVQSIDAGQTGLLANVRVVRVLFTSTALVLGVRALHRLVFARRAFDAVVAVGAVRDGASIFVVRAFWAIRA
jgi:hypothetical protein